MVFLQLPIAIDDRSSLPLEEEEGEDAVRVGKKKEERKNYLTQKVYTVEAQGL